MAVSPLVIPPGSSEKPNTINKSKLSTAYSSKAATPEVTQVSNGTGRDLAEQMNEEERHKYVKGI